MKSLESSLLCVVVLLFSCQTMHTGSSNVCPPTQAKIRQLQDGLTATMQNVFQDTAKQDLAIPDQYIYHPAEPEQLVQRLRQQGRTTLIKICPCNDYPLVLSDALITYEPHTQQEEASEDEGRSTPIPNYLLIDPTRASAELETVDISKFTSGSINEHKPGDQIIAILDTGIDPVVFPPDPHLWTPDSDAYRRQHRHLRLPQIQGGISLIGKGGTIMTPPRTLKEIYAPPADEEGHGTAIAAIINHFAHSGYRFMVIKAIDKNGHSSSFDMMCALLYARENGADYVNLSWGFYGNRQLKPLVTALDQYFDEAGDRAYFASLGNEHINVENLAHYPSQLAANHRHLRGVAAAQGDLLPLPALKTKTNYRFAGFSNFSCRRPHELYPADQIRLLDQILRGTSFAAPQSLAIQYLHDQDNRQMTTRDIVDGRKKAKVLD